MVKGLGTVYRKTRTRKDGGTREFYVAQIRIHDENGQARIIEGQGQSPSDAVDARTRAIARALNGTVPVTQRRTPTREGTINASITEWSNTRAVGARTREHTNAVIKNHISSTIGDKTINRVTEQDILNLIESRETQWTRVAVYKCLHAYLKYAEKTGLITHNPMTRIDEPRAPRAKGATSPDMEERVKRLRGMIAWMKRTKWNEAHPMYWARIMLALNGLRPGEARGLTWDAVEDLRKSKGMPRIIINKQLGYQHGTLTLIPHAKNDNPRIVLLRESTRQALLTWKKAQTSLKRRKSWKPLNEMENLILTTDNGKPLRQQNDSTQWKAIQSEAQKNYKKTVYWTMAYNRHIAVTLLRDAGVAPSIVAVIMGHTIAVEDKKYYHAQLSAQQEAFQKLDEQA
jgi:integrase